MDLKTWNLKFLDYLGYLARPGQPLVFYVDKNTLMQVGEKESEAVAYEDFLEAVRTEGSTHFFLRAKNSLREWKRGEVQVEPPFLAAIALTVLAVSESVRIGNASVYRTLNAMLGDPGLDTQRPMGYHEVVPELWKEFNAFFSGSSFGAVPTAASVGRFRFQGWARSQALLNLTERNQVVKPFVTGYRGEWEPVSAVDGFYKYLRRHLGDPRSRSVYDKFEWAPKEIRVAGSDQDLVFSILEAVRCSITGSVDGSEVSVHSLRGRLKFDLEEELATAFSLVCSVTPEFNQYFHAEDPEWLERMQIHSEDEAEIYLEMEDLELLRTGGEKPVAEGITVKVAAKAIRPFETSKAYGGYIEIHDRNSHKPTHYLVDELVLPELEDIQCERESLPAPEGLAWVKANSYLDARVDVVSSMRPARTVRFAGGLKAFPQGHTYLNGHFPTMYISGADGERVFVNGEEVRVPEEGLNLAKAFHGAPQLQIRIGKSAYLVSSVDYGSIPTKPFHGVARVHAESQSLGVRDLGPSACVDPGLLDGIQVREGDVFAVIDSTTQAWFISFTPEVFQMRGRGIDQLKLRKKYFLNQVPDGKLLIRRNVNGVFCVWGLGGRGENSRVPHVKNAKTWLQESMYELLNARFGAFQMNVRNLFSEYIRLLRPYREEQRFNTNTSKYAVKLPRFQACAIEDCEGNPYDELLAFVSARGRVGAQTLQAAWDAIADSKDVRHKHHTEVIDLLEQMGHISVRGAEVEISRPTFVPLERFTAFSLVGFRTPQFMSSIREDSQSNGPGGVLTDFLSWQQSSNRNLGGLWLGPTTIVATWDPSEDLGEVQNAFESLGMRVLSSIPSSRALVSNSWPQFLKSRVESYEGRPSGIPRFPVKRVRNDGDWYLEFADRPTSDISRILALTGKSGPTRWLFENREGCLRLSRELALWGLFQGDRQSVRCTPKSVFVRRKGGLPSHLLAVLYAVTGMPPLPVEPSDVKRLNLRGEWDRFDGIPQELAHNWIQKLGVENAQD